MLNGIRLASVLCVSCAFLFLSGTAAANGQAHTFRKTQISLPTDYNTPIILDFPLDGKACKQQHGANWLQLCSGVPGLPDEPGRDIRIEPEIPGSWWWISPDRLIFTPARSWPANQKFTIHLSENSVRPSVQLTSPQSLSFTTLPDAAQVVQSRLWIDPSPEGKHGLSFVARFLYPQAEEVSSRFLLSVGASGDELQASRPRLGAMRFTWNHDRTELNVSVPITTLGETDSAVQFRLAGYPLVSTQNGQISIASNQEPEGRVLIAPKSALLGFRDAEIQTVNNAQLQKEYQLSVGSNALLDAAFLGKHISAVQLPLKRDREALEAYDWSQAPVVGREDLERGIPLRLESISSEDAPSTRLFYRLPDFDISKGRYVHIAVPAGVRAPSGIALGKDFTAVVTTPYFDRELRFMQTGSVLPLGSNGRLGLHASGLDAIHWNVTQVLPQYISQVSASSGSFSEPSLPFDVYGSRHTGVLTLQRGKPGSPQFPTLDLRPFLEQGKGIFHVQLEGIIRRENGREETAISAGRFVLATDLGLMLKKSADGSRSVFICSLSEGKPLGGVKLDILGANGLPVMSTRSDEEGRAEVPSLDGLRREKAPTVIVASRDEDMAFLPLNDGMLVSYARHAQSGLGSSQTTQAHVFSQRDMYRPGETLYFAAIVKNEQFAPVSSDLPLEGVLLTPEGKELRQPVKTDAYGMLDCSWDLPEAALTGKYVFNLCVAGGSKVQYSVILGSTSVSVQEFQPDILSVKTGFTDKDGKAVRLPKGWIRSDTMYAAVHLNNLFGAPAQDRRVKVNVASQPTRLSLSAYEDYTVHTPGTYISPVQRPLPDVRTDAEGRTLLKLHLPDLFPGSWGRSLARFSMDVEGFEPGGGRSVRDELQCIVSSLDYVLASRPSALLDFIPKGRDVTVDFLALDNDLTPLNPGALTLVLSEPRTIVNLVSDHQGVYRYEQVPANRELSRETVRFADGESGPALTWTLPTQIPGERQLDVFNTKGELLASIPFTVAGQALAQGDDLPSGIIRARLDKTDYDPGETMNIALTAPFDGLGLLTLEREKVFTHVWFKASAGESVQSLRIPENFEGRAFLNISFIRSLNSPDIYLRPHMYHVEPLTVNISRRDLKLALNAPAQVQPGDTVTVRLSAKDEGRAAIFAVDEGVLQLSHYSTPSPLDVLLRQRRLEVQTSQAFDLLMPDQRHIQNLLSAFGGGGFDMVNSIYLNPFKRKGEPPVSLWLGLVDVGPSEKTISFTVPEYFNGKIRIMAVGSSLEAVGSASVETEVHGPLVITPQLPLMAAPDDEFDVGFSVANTQDDNTGRINLTFEADEGLEIVGPVPDHVIVEPGSETLLTLRLRALDTPGNARISLHAQSEQYSIVRSGTLSVRPSSPRMSQLQTGFLQTSLSLPLERELYPNDAVVEAAVSGLPLPAIRGLVRYLDTYPYGCTEQLISKAFPYALLLKKPELLRQTGETAENLNKRVLAMLRATVDALHSRYRSEGLPRWNEYEADTLNTAYALDFLLTLREAGYGQAVNLERQLIQALRSRLGRQIASAEDARAHAYGIWVLSRSGDVTTRQLSQLIDYVRTDMPEWNRDITAPLIAAAFAILRLDDQALHSLNAYKPKDLDGDGTRSLFDPSVRRSLYLSILARHFPDRLSSVSSEERRVLADTLIESVRTHSGTTFTAAQAIRALLTLSDATPVEGVTLTCASDEAIPQDLGSALTALDGQTCSAFTVTLPEKHPGVYWQIFSDGFDRHPPEGTLSSGMEIEQEILNSNGEPVRNVGLGSTATVRLRLRGHGGPVQNVAIVSLLPGGFELVPEGLPLDQGERPFMPDFTDRREDRMLIFGTVEPREHTFSYQIRAVNKGRFALPSAYAEAMYSQTVRARSSGGSIEVQ